MVKRKKYLDNTQKKWYKARVMRIVADIYYDRESISSEYLREMASFLLKYRYLGPKGTDEIILYLYRVYNILVNSSKNGCNLYVNKDGTFLSLAELEKRGHLPYYCDGYYQIAELTKNIIMENPVNLVFFDLAICKTCLKMTQKLMKENNEELNQAFQNSFSIDIVLYLNASTPEKRYRHLKDINTFIIDYNNDTSKEFSEVENTNLIKAENLQEKLRINRYNLYLIGVAGIRGDKELIRKRMI